MSQLIPIFDIDDTLFCEHDYVRSGFDAVAKHISTLFPYLNKGKIYDDFIVEWELNGRGKIFNVVCQKYGIDMSINELVHVYRGHKPKIKLYEDAGKVLPFLKERNIPIGIITDGDSIMQWRKIEALELNELIDVIIVSNDLGSDCWKPSYIPYQEVSKRLEVSLNDCVYIGDNPHKDFVTAKQLGMKTVRIIRPCGDHMETSLEKEYEADRNISSLLELLQDFGDFK
ncbi:HAD family hydrolase [Alkalihalobacterium sp. APHAB7]|uniref:HAD family hydrolase n=1 Tax=Alkalihalobacterium sp. APHAB7 TaxID=3402081 RepID=UPI003AABDDD1